MSEILLFVFLALSVSCVLKSIGYKGVGVSVALILISLFAVLLRYVGEIGMEMMALFDVRTLGVGRDLSKILGITYLSSICESTCLSLGESEISKIVDVWGRVEIIAVLLPYFKAILLLGGEML